MKRPEENGSETLVQNEDILTVGEDRMAALDGSIWKGVLQRGALASKIDSNDSNQFTGL